MGTKVAVTKAEARLMDELFGPPCPACGERPGWVEVKKKAKKKSKERKT